jgi:enamine deaminase RidA (YjgF/YER057c/UK114 family)
MTTPDRAPVFAVPGWPAHYTYVPALRVGDMVFLSGTTGTDESGRIAAPGDIVATTDYFTTTENCTGTAAVLREPRP